MNHGPELDDALAEILANAGIGAEPELRTITARGSHNVVGPSTISSAGLQIQPAPQAAQWSITLDDPLKDRANGLRLVDQQAAAAMRTWLKNRQAELATQLERQVLYGLH